MLEIGDIEHVESIVTERFPLRNCGSWNRIKNELAETLNPSHTSTMLEIVGDLRSVSEKARLLSNKVVTIAQRSQQL